jgi:hypothetical protein
MTSYFFIIIRMIKKREFSTYENVDKYSKIDHLKKKIDAKDI